MGDYFQMGGWIWGTFTLVAAFALLFLVLPDPTRVKTVVLLLMLAFQGMFGNLIIRKTPYARLWWLYMALAAINLAFCSLGIGLTAGFMIHPFGREHWLALILGIAVLSGLGWQFGSPRFAKQLEADRITGRFDLARGTFSFQVPPSSLFVQYRSPMLRRVAAILVLSSAMLTAVAAAWSLQFAKTHWSWKDLAFGSLAMGMGCFIAIGSSAPLYTYLWIRRWEKSTGRTMWIKGFEPGAQSS